VNVKLQPGAATESVQVNGDLVPLLQTADASIGTTINSEEIQRLPTFGADPYELVRTAPGITGDGARSGTGRRFFFRMVLARAVPTPEFFKQRTRSRSQQPVSARPTTISWLTV